MNKNVNYGNWVPEKMLALCYVAAAVLGIAAYVTGPVLHLAIPTWILGILAAICLVYGIYMHICHELFAFGKGNMMAKVHQHLVDSSGMGRRRHSARHRMWCGCPDDPLRQGFPQGKTRRYGLLGCRVELCQRAM